MSPFLGTHQNRLDPKLRVSIPAAFRTALKGDAGNGASGLILRPSHRHPCIEAWPEPVFAALEAPVAALDLFSDSHDAMAAALYADACRVEPDKDGRVTLPDDMVAYASLGETVTFMGLGRIFQIWAPPAAAAFREAARSRANIRGLTLPGAAA